MNEGVRNLQLAHRKIEAGQGHAAGRALLEEMYRERTGSPMPAICVTPRGKPYFLPEENIHGLHFSISHTKNYVFCVLSQQPVGLDAEEADREIDLRLAEKILSPAEKRRFSAQKDPQTALLKLWVLKEAAAKLSGQGLQGYPNHTDFDPQDPRVQEIDGCYVAILE